MRKRAVFLLCRGALLCVCFSWKCMWPGIKHKGGNSHQWYKQELGDGGRIAYTQNWWGYHWECDLLKWFSFERVVFWVVPEWQVWVNSEVNLKVKVSTLEVKSWPWLWGPQWISQGFLFTVSWVAVESTRRERASMYGAEVLWFTYPQKFRVAGGNSEDSFLEYIMEESLTPCDA